jgi:ankyrin repeat protein
MFLLAVFIFSSCTKPKTETVELIAAPAEQLSTPPSEQEQRIPTLLEQNYTEDDKLLILAVKDNDIESVTSLLNNGANPNIVLDDSNSLLMWAIQQLNSYKYTIDENRVLKYEALIKLLLEKGADVNYTSRARYSVFQFASLFLSDDILPLFIDSGLDLLGRTTINGAVYPYFQCLIIAKKPKTALLFLTHDKVLQKVLTDSSMASWLIGMGRPGTKEILDYLVANGLQLDTDEPLLYEAIWNNNYDMVLCLLDNGISPTKRYEGDNPLTDGLTPLEYAKDNISYLYKKYRMLGEIELDESSPQIIEGRKIIRLLEERIAAEEKANERKTSVNDKT